MCGCDALRYDSEMKEDGITDILKVGIAFSGKNVSVRTKKYHRSFLIR